MAPGKGVPGLHPAGGKPAWDRENPWRTPPTSGASALPSSPDARRRQGGVQGPGPRPGSHPGCEGPGTRREPQGLVRPRPPLGPTPVCQQALGAEERSRPHALPRLAPSPPLSLGRGPLVTLVWSSPLPCRSCPLRVPCASPWVSPPPLPPTASLHPWPSLTSAPDPHCGLSLPRTAQQEAGRGLGGRKGEHWPFRVGGLPLSDTGRESQHFSKGNVSLGNCGVPEGATRHGGPHLPPGHRAKVLQGSSHPGTPTEPEEGGWGGR